MSKETPKSAPTPKDAPKGLIDSKLFQGFAKAKETFMSKEAAKKGPLGRLWLAFTAFLGEIGLIKKEKEKVSKSTEDAVAKTLEQAKKDAEKGVGLKDDVSESDRKEYLEVLATATGKLKDLGKEREAHGREGLKKLGDAVEDGKEEKMTFKQMTAVSAVGLGTLLEMKKGLSQSQFEAKLKKLWKISEDSKYPFRKLFGTSVLKIFAIKNPLDFLELLDSMGVGLFGANSIRKTFSKLKDGPLTGSDKKDAVEFFDKHVFTSGKSNTGKLLDTIGRLVKKKPKALTPEHLTEIMYSVESQDWENLIHHLKLKGKSAPKKDMEKLAA